MTVLASEPRPLEPATGDYRTFSLTNRTKEKPEVDDMEILERWTAHWATGDFQLLHAQTQQKQTICKQPDSSDIDSFVRVKVELTRS